MVAWFALTSQIVNAVMAKITISMRMPSSQTIKLQAFVAKAPPLLVLQPYLASQACLDALSLRACGV